MLNKKRSLQKKAWMSLADQTLFIYWCLSVSSRLLQVADCQCQFIVNRFQSKH